MKATRALHIGLLLVLLLAVICPLTVQAGTHDLKTYFPGSSQAIKWFRNYPKWPTDPLPPQGTLEGKWGKFYGDRWWANRSSNVYHPCDLEFWDVYAWYDERLDYTETIILQQREGDHWPHWYRDHYPDGTTYLPRYISDGQSWEKSGYTRGYYYRDEVLTHSAQIWYTSQVTTGHTVYPWGITNAIRFTNEANILTNGTDWSYYWAEMYLGIHPTYGKVVLIAKGGHFQDHYLTAWNYWFQYVGDSCP